MTRMEQPITKESIRQYRVLIDSLVTEGRVFKRGDLIGPEDAPGEIESMLHAGIITPVTADERSSGPSLR